MAEENAPIDNGWTDSIEGIEPKATKQLILKQISDKFTDGGLENICSLFGKVSKFHRPPGKPFAFVTFETEADAQNSLRKLKEQNKLQFIAEFSRGKEWTDVTPVYEEDGVLFSKRERSLDNTLHEPQLEKKTRIIQGPFEDPALFDVTPLISDADYKNPKLPKADPTKNFLWNSHDMVTVNTALTTIEHGRKVYKKSTEMVIDTVEKPYKFHSHGVSVLDIPQCTECQLPAGMYCETSKKPYCSIECLQRENVQTNDGDDQPLNDDIVKVSPMKLKQKVKITHVINHRLVFVRPGSTEDDIAFAKCINDVTVYAQTSEHLTAQPEIGEMVLAHFGGFYQRALVLKHISDCDVAVAFIDFGNVETQKFTEMKRISTELKQIECFATKITLNNIDNDLMDERAVEFLYNLVVYDVELEITDMIESSTGIVAMLQSSDDWVSESINSLNTKAIIDLYKDGDISRVFQLDYKLVDEGENIPVLITDNSHVGSLSEISFIFADDIDLFHKNYCKVQAICNFLFEKEEWYTPALDEYCLCQHVSRQRWYRGYCCEIRTDGFATLLFIDYGNVQLIPVNSIRKIPNQLLFACITQNAELVDDSPQGKDDREAAIKVKYPRMSRQVFEYLKMKNGALIGKLK